MANELLVYRLLTMHNLWYYQRHMARIRAAIAEGRFAELLAAHRPEVEPAAETE
jgi:queuine tRNA-ribosyltransferase